MIHGPFDRASWITMLMLKQDNREMAAIDADKHRLAINCNNTCLKEFYRQVA